MTKIIEKKTWIPYFEYIYTGKKNFEIRLGNFPGEIGDIIKFYEYDQFTEKYTKRFITKTITYKVPIVFKVTMPVFKDLEGHDDVHAYFGPNKDEFWTPDQLKEHGLVVMGIE